MGLFSNIRGRLQRSGTQADKLSVSAYLKTIYEDVKENIDYVVTVEGVDIPQVWQQRILEPLAFAFALQTLNEGKVTDLLKNSPDTNTRPSEASKAQESATTGEMDE